MTAQTTRTLRGVGTESHDNTMTPTRGGLWGWGSRGLGITKCRASSERLAGFLSTPLKVHLLSSEPSGAVGYLHFKSGGSARARHPLHPSNLLTLINTDHPECLMGV